jgi:hypothetical protein
MRCNYLLSALLVSAALAATASANNRVVKARYYDETTPQCASAGCASAGCASAGCAETCCAAQSCAPPCCDTGCGNVGCEAGCGKCRRDRRQGAAGVCQTDVCQAGHCDDVCGDCNGSGCGRCGRCCQKINNTLQGNGRHNIGNMPPHYPYDAVRGYYYFHPYNHRHICEHQHAVTQWGGDPRNPYANEIFQSVYAEMEAMNWQDMGTPGEEVAPPTVPTPVADPAAATTGRGTIRSLRLISSRGGVR